ncbi:hypothetical protein ACSBR2_026916 [Camellia fascicularis]
MNSTKNSGRGLLVPPENDVEIQGPWMLVTPEKPILARSNGIPVERHGNCHQLGKANWHELVGLAGRNLRQKMNFYGASQNFNLAGLMGENGSSYNLNVPQAEKGGFSHQNGISYDLGVPQAEQGGFRRQNGIAYKLGVPQANKGGFSHQNESSYNLGVPQPEKGGFTHHNGSSYSLAVSGAPRAEQGGFSHNVGFYTQTIGTDSAVWNNNPLAELLGIKNAESVDSANGMSNKCMDEANTPTILNSYSQVDSSWTEGNFTSLLLGCEDHTPGSNQLINSDRSTQRANDGFPVPLWPNYNLNLPPRSEADATSRMTNSFPFAPVTPDHTKQFENHRHSEMLSFSVDESSSQEKDTTENILTSIGSDAIENRCNEMLQNIVDSSSAAVSLTLKEKKNSELEGDRGTDVNETPQQKTPKRRKHRPKVVVEGKPKRTPKPTTPNNTDSKESPTGKRKYVRKKSLEATLTQQIDATNEATVSTFEPREKSCRKVLNFDTENVKKGEIQGNNLRVAIHQENQSASNLDSQSTELYTGINSIIGGSTCNLTRSINQMPEECISLPQGHAPSVPPAAVKYNTLNDIARRANMKDLSPYPKSDKNGYSQGHQHLQEELKMNNFQANNTHKNLEQIRQMTWQIQSTPQMVERHLANSDEKRGSKREYLHANEQAGPSVENWMGSPFLCQEMYQVDDRNSNGSIFGTRCSETHKKRRIENGFHTAVCSTPCVAVVKDDLRQAATEGRNSIYTNNYASQINSRNTEGDKTSNSKKPKNGVNGTCGDFHFHSITDEHNMQKQRAASELLSNTERMADKRFSRSTQAHNITSPTAMVNLNLPSSSWPKIHTSGFEQAMETLLANMSVKRQDMAPTSANPVSSRANKVLLQEHKDASHGHQQYSTKARGKPEKQKHTVTIDEITCRLQGLNITGRSKETDGQEENALVPYKGGGTMVPFDPIKKRKPRPKVDLDPETNRIWKLLMEKEGNEGTEVEDKDKEKWWEEERKVFRGRADSFIARMHLVQGDRRFSQWKGSVVDSVIGVFLTQNVSDHLSSSAFMSLAARFPLQSTTIDQTWYQSGTSSMTEEPEIQMLDPSGSMKFYEKIVRQPVYSQASVTYHESSEHRTNYSISGTRRTSLAIEHKGIATEKGSSSHNNFDSFGLQINGEIQSCLGSNSEAEDSTCWDKCNKNHGPPTSLLDMGRTASFQVLHSPVTGNSCFDDRSAHWHWQSENVDHNQQIPRFENFNNLKNSSALTQPINSYSSHLQGPIVPPSHFQLHMTPDLASQEVDCFGTLREESIFSLPSTASGMSKGKAEDYMSRRVGHTAERISKPIIQQNGVPIIQAPTMGSHAFLSRHPTHQESSLQSGPCTGNDQLPHNTRQQDRFGTFQLESALIKEPIRHNEAFVMRQSGTRHQVPNDPKCARQAFDGVEERITVVDKQKFLENKAVVANAKEQEQSYFSGEVTTGMSVNMSNAKKGKVEDEKRKSFDWDCLRKQAQPNGRRKERNKNTMDSLDYEAIRCADVNEISNSIRERGMNNLLAERMKDFLNRMVREHGSIDLEWLRDVPPDKAKDYLLSIRGLGLKSVECVRLLTLHHLAFPVDTNVGRIAVRLGWVPLQPLPESLQLHLLELYPMLETIQKYLWPRLCKLDQRTLYELHYQMITFGKVFCTKSKPNCNACPMRGECRHFASAFASARLALPGPEERSIVSSTMPIATDKGPPVAIKLMPLPPAGSMEPKEMQSVVSKYEPIVEEPTTPEPETTEVTESDIEDAFYEDPDDIPTIKLNIEQFTQNLQNYMQENMELHVGDMSKALVALNPEAASIPTPKLKNVSRLRTEHQVYELPDSHPLLKGLDKREPDDPSPYLLAIWTPGETANSIQPPEGRCGSQESGKLCNEQTCFSCSSVREANSLTVRGTLLIPCRTAMRGSFPLNGTYFQVNEMFADHESSRNPIDVPRAWIWNLPRRTVYFGTSVSSIFKGLQTEEIQYCFWRGFVCVRGFDHKTRAPRPLMARLHFPASKLTKTKNEDK